MSFASLYIRIRFKLSSLEASSPTFFSKYKYANAQTSIDLYHHVRIGGKLNHISQTNLAVWLDLWLLSIIRDTYTNKTAIRQRMAQIFISLVYSHLKYEIKSCHSNTLLNLHYIAAIGIKKKTIKVKSSLPF